MNIRPACASDRQALLLLYQAFIMDMQPFDADAETEDSQLLQWIEDGTSGDVSQIWVADVGARLVGFTRVREKTCHDSPSHDRYAKLDDLFISPDARRNGLACMLMDQAHAWTINRKLPYIVLNVYQANAPARMLYERQGYQRLCDRSHGRIMMIKALALSLP